jgi:hypothetical protein
MVNHSAKSKCRWHPHKLGRKKPVYKVAADELAAKLDAMSTEDRISFEKEQKVRPLAVDHPLMSCRALASFVLTALLFRARSSVFVVIKHAG